MWYPVHYRSWEGRVWAVLATIWWVAVVATGILAFILGHAELIGLYVVALPGAVLFTTLALATRRLMQGEAGVHDDELVLLEKGGWFRRLTWEGALRLRVGAVERREDGSILGVTKAGWLGKVRVRFDPTDQAEADAVFRALEACRERGAPRPV